MNIKDTIKDCIRQSTPANSNIPKNYNFIHLIGASIASVIVSVTITLFLTKNASDIENITGDEQNIITHSTIIVPPKEQAKQPKKDDTQYYACIDFDEKTADKFRAYLFAEHPRSTHKIKDIQQFDSLMFLLFEETKVYCEGREILALITKKDSLAPHQVALSVIGHIATLVKNKDPFSIDWLDMDYGGISKKRAMPTLKEKGVPVPEEYLKYEFGGDLRDLKKRAYAWLGVYTKYLDKENTLLFYNKLKEHLPL